ncbi:hypothetical protein TW95_gp1595 [Pandoravirus inopinatum]|uniref:Uncharacterized protein n=1 Tax=Pandoravirus inopinatum TaxID=1605721 RepID=A0A0B5J3Z3_9VIRU|nr:hypothetical protein TW95_gp1595 [Pandoravirus inopinatum]AJF98329.1 hypothetical protein [Pandoravirus inopinatum]
MNDRATRATAVRGEGRARIVDARQRRASSAHMAMGPSQPSPYGAVGPTTATTTTTISATAAAAIAAALLWRRTAGPVYSIRSPAMPSTARRMSRAYGDAPGDPRYYGDARAPSGPNGVVAGISSNVRSTAAGATIRRDHTVYTAPPRDCGPGGVVSHMPPSANYGAGTTAGATYDPGDGYYGTAPPLAQQQQQAYGAARTYAAEPPPPPPPMQNGANNTANGWYAPNGGGGGGGNNNANNTNAYGVAQVQPQPTYGGPPMQPPQTQQPQQPSYGQAAPLAQQGQPYAQPPPSSTQQGQQQQQPQQAYGQGRRQMANNNNSSNRNRPMDRRRRSKRPRPMPSRNRPMARPQRMDNSNNSKATVSWARRPMRAPPATAIVHNNNRPTVSLAPPPILPSNKCNSPSTVPNSRRSAQRNSRRRRQRMASNSQRPMPKHSRRPPSPMAPWPSPSRLSVPWHHRPSALWRSSPLEPSPPRP